MSRLSTSGSEAFTWTRLRRDVVRILLMLLGLELLCRWQPVQSALSNRLDPYENLLWYDFYLPAYQAQLQARPDYTIWLVGSSYMMSGLSPQLVQGRLHERGFADVTVQNYGMNRMVNLEVMSQVFDRWLLTLDQPRYMVVAVSQRNFTVAAYESADILTSPYESMYIFPDSLDDYFRGFLFKNSAFYRYMVLARNATFIPPEETVRLPRPQGGYVERETTLNCSENTEDKRRLINDMEGGLRRLDRFIDVIQAHNIPALVVNLPVPLCTITYQGYTDFDDYAVNYLQPLARHLQNRSVPFMELDTRFQAEVPEDIQQQYFFDATHANRSGAVLFSRWTADFVASWLETLPPESALSHAGR